MEVGDHMASRVPNEAGALSCRTLLGGCAEHGLRRAQEAGDVHHARPIRLQGHLAGISHSHVIWSKNILWCKCRKGWDQSQSCHLVKKIPCGASAERSWCRQTRKIGNITPTIALPPGNRHPDSRVSS